jgi:hypothetical protein
MCLLGFVWGMVAGSEKRKNYAGSEKPLPVLIKEKDPL